MIRGTVTCRTALGNAVTVDLRSLLDAAAREHVHADAIAWIKRLRLVRYGTVAMRDRFLYRGESLWWFTEIYLHKTRGLQRAVATVRALETAAARWAGATMHVESPDHAVRDTAVAFGAAHTITITTSGAPPVRRRAHWRAHLLGVAASLSRVRPTSVRTVRPAQVAAFVHNAFWREGAGRRTGGQESYIGPVLEALDTALPAGELAYVGVGPRRNFRARRWWDPLLGGPVSGPHIVPVERFAPRAALADSTALWRDRHDLARTLVSGDAIRAAGTVRGCDLWPVLEQELRDAAWLQWPWSARAMDEAGAALDRLTPRTVVTYAEAGGWGRALVIEARRRGIRSIGVQHGFIYRHWLNYLHEPDEMAPSAGGPGFPRPDTTLLFDDFAAAHLRDAGRFPPRSLAVIGSPRLDELSIRMASLRPDRDDLRRRFGVEAGQALVVLAAKFTEIREELPSLCQAVAASAGVRLVIKTHPAETAEAYATVTAGIGNIHVAGAETDLAALLAATDAVVTMNSTVALDGLVLGVPAIVLGLPNNLSPFVAAGVMAGADREDIGAVLAAVLYDRRVRAGLREKAAAFVATHGMRADGQAARRASALILDTTAPRDAGAGRVDGAGPQELDQL